MNIYQVGEGAELPTYAYRKARNLTDGRSSQATTIYIEPGKQVPVIEPFEHYLSMVLLINKLVQHPDLLCCSGTAGVSGILLGMHEWI